LVETFKTNAFNASFNAFVLDRVIGPFGTCNWIFAGVSGAKIQGLFGSSYALFSLVFWVS
jgi:hypothetical protein